MTQLHEAIARYHRILENPPYRDLSWADELQHKMREQHLTLGGRVISPVLRPHFISQRQYTGLVKASEALYSALERAEKLALSTPALLARMQMLPAEKMLASVNPGYSYAAVTSLLDTHLNNGTLRIVGYNADTPSGAIYGEALNNLFYDAEPVREFRKKYKLTKVGTTKPLVHSILKAYKEFGGKKSPNIAILEFRQAFQSSDSGEYQLLMDCLRRDGYQTQVVSPDQLEYRDGVLRKGDFRIDLIYRRVRVSEFLVRFDLTHPLVRAYRDHAVCIVNSFRSELAQKKAMFDLLTDESVTSSFPAVERKAIRDFIPWTRVFTAGKTAYKDQTVDLPEFVIQNRERFVLKPNDDSGDRDSYRGSEMDQTTWERTVKMALRDAYVVQELVAAATFDFPVNRYGTLDIQPMHVDVQPHAFLGKVNGCSSWLRAATGGGFSTVAGLAPTYILDPK
jgi:uncharacterized circularly permuted ATP-grasp superfamily protein